MYLVGKRGRHGENHPTDIFSHPEGFRTPSHPPCREPVVAGMAPVACQTVANPDSLGAVGNAWNVEYFVAPSAHQMQRAFSNQSNRYFLASSAIKSAFGRARCDLWPPWIWTWGPEMFRWVLAFQMRRRNETRSGALSNQRCNALGELQRVGQDHCRCHGWVFWCLVDGQGPLASRRKDIRRLGWSRCGRFFRHTAETLGLGLHQRDPGRRQQEHHLQCGVLERRIWLWLEVNTTAREPAAVRPPREWYGFYFPESEYRRYPRALMLSISGMVPMTKRRWLITENYFVTQSAFPKVVQRRSRFFWRTG